MNSAILRKARRILSADSLTAEDERAFLMRAFALAWTAGVTKRSRREAANGLSGFLPASVPSVSAETQRRLNVLLNAAPAGQEGEPNAFTPEILALLQEEFSGQTRSRGAFYTPWTTAKRLAQETLTAWTAARQNADQKLQTPSSFTACDPAAGAGGLILPLWLELAGQLQQAGKKQTPADLLESCANRLYAGDLDQNALQTLRLRAALTYLALTGQKPPQTLFSNIREGDALAGEKTSVWREQFPRVFAAGGFDVLLCNPPYVGQKGNKEIFESLRRNPRWRPHISPKGDLLYLFFHLALELLKPGGTAGFLTTSYFAGAASAAGLRARMKQEAAFLRLIDFNAARLFARAPGQHNLISVFQKTADKTVLCRVGDKHETQTVAQEALYSGPSDFLNIHALCARESAVLRKMAAAPHRLKDVARVSNGLMTGCDKISAAHLRRHQLPGVQKGDGVFVLSAAEKNALNLPSEEQTKLKPFFKNSDIFPFAARTEPTEWLVDFFYPNDRGTDFSKYPRLTAHLARFKSVLLARKQNNNGIDKQLKRGVYWFGSVRRRMDFDSPKLAAPHRARLNTFAFAPGPWYASSDVYFISAPKPGFSLWYLLALFNSAPYYTWLFFNGKRKGNLLELYAQPLEELPIPRPTPLQKTELETLARKIYAAKTANPDADASAAWRRINALAAELFGLSEKELKLTEKMRNKSA